ncbi:hypothetical protein C8F01DRAFT_718613 [Mycena amicta]|nr:hypothetical protein C8F01DRAFT_718613 [Mycena amicta]
MASRLPLFFKLPPAPFFGQPTPSSLSSLASFSTTAPPIATELGTHLPGPTPDVSPLPRSIRSHALALDVARHVPHQEGRISMDSLDRFVLKLGCTFLAFIPPSSPIRVRNALAVVENELHQRWHHHISSLHIHLARSPRPLLQIAHELVHNSLHTSSAATPICVPSDLTVVENERTQDRHPTLWL